MKNLQIAFFICATFWMSYINSLPLVDNGQYKPELINGLYNDGSYIRDNSGKYIHINNPYLHIEGIQLPYEHLVGPNGPNGGEGGFGPGGPGGPGGPDGPGGPNGPGGSHGPNDNEPIGSASDTYNVQIQYPFGPPGPAAQYLPV